MCLGRIFVNDFILEIKDLRVSFPGKIKTLAVDGVSLSIRKGSFFSLVGASGSGKTVTALSVCRLLDADIQGRIFYQSRDLLTLSPKELVKVRGRRIAYIFQDPGSSLNPVLRVGEQIAEARRAHFRESDAAVKGQALKLLADVKTADPERVFRAYPHELSGGMKQRAMIAMALAMEPDLLIADEPTTALDPDTASGILKLLVSLNREKGLTVFFVTHQITLAALYSDGMATMASGRIIERLHKTNNQFSPQTEYAKKLFASDLGGLKPKERIPV